MERKLSRIVQKLCMCLNDVDKHSKNNCNISDNESAKNSVDIMELSPIQNEVEKVLE